MDFKSIFFYASNRWDILTIDNVLIKLPEKNLSDGLRIAHKIIKDDRFKNNRTLDLRISNRIIIKKMNNKNFDVYFDFGSSKIRAGCI